MQQPKRWGLGALMAVTLAAAGGVVHAVVPEPLGALVEDLFTSLAAGDDRGVGRAICADFAVRHHLGRLERLGLLANGTDPGMIREYRTRYLRSVYDRWQPLIERRGVRALLDDTTIGAAPADSDPETMRPGPAAAPRAITATGVVEVYDPGGMGLDIGAYEVQGRRWCLQPALLPQ